MIISSVHRRRCAAQDAAWMEWRALAAPQVAVKRWAGVGTRSVAAQSAVTDAALDPGVGALPGASLTAVARR